MRHLICVLFFLPFISGCDSSVKAPELSIEIVNPGEETVIRRGEIFSLKIDITSALDLRDLDIKFAAKIDSLSSVYTWSDIEIKQGEVLRQFVVDTTLIMPVFEGLETGVYTMGLDSPSGTNNTLTIFKVRIE